MKVEPNASNTANIKDLIDKVDSSNQTIFNILLPVFGAWVGVVVAFYFGTEQAKKAQDALKEQAKSADDLLVKALSLDKDKLAKHTVSELLKKYPSASDVAVVVNLTDHLKQVLEKFKLHGFSNLVVVNKEQPDKPLGILYYLDLLRTDKILSNKFNDIETTQLKEIIVEIHKDFVTNEQWSPSGLVNYAELQTNVTLLEAINRMSTVGINNKVNDVLGLVIEGGKMIGVVTYDMILGFVKGL